ncbi:MAG TPA: hypothetical protein VJ885_15580, partial [Thermoanaerobaculia bacterium]|nr:hypothetical protein [Thermoanaerobaculia bacterium]
MNAVTSKDAKSWKETLYLLASPANAEHLLRSLAEAEAGLTQERELLERGTRSHDHSRADGIGHCTPARR